MFVSVLQSLENMDSNQVHEVNKRGVLLFVEIDSEVYGSTDESPSKNVRGNADYNKFEFRPDTFKMRWRLG